MDQHTANQVLQLLQEQATRDTGNPVLNLILGLGVVAIIAITAAYVILKVKGVRDDEPKKGDRGKYEIMEVEQQKTAEAVHNLAKEVKELEGKVDKNHAVLIEKMDTQLDKLREMIFNLAAEKRTG